MPRIKISVNELFEILKMPDSREEIFQAWSHILKHGFIFDNFTLITEESTVGHQLMGIGTMPKHTYKVKVEGTEDEQKIYVKIIVTKKDGLTYTMNKEVTVVEFLDKLASTVNEFKGKRMSEWDVARDEVDVLPPMMFMQYAVLKSMNREVVDMPVTKRKYKPLSERKQSKPKDEYKLFEVIRRYSKHINHSRHHMTCEAWGVKGHFRHYKNGKTVYVKPYTKGKGKVKERTYTL